MGLHVFVFPASGNEWKCKTWWGRDGGRWRRGAKEGREKEDENVMRGDVSKKGTSGPGGGIHRLVHQHLTLGPTPWGPHAGSSRSWHYWSPVPLAPKCGPCPSCVPPNRGCAGGDGPRTVAGSSRGQLQVKLASYVCLTPKPIAPGRQGTGAPRCPGRSPCAGSSAADQGSFTARRLWVR